MQVFIYFLVIAALSLVIVRFGGGAHAFGHQGKMASAG